MSCEEQIFMRTTAMTLLLTACSLAWGCSRPLASKTTADVATKKTGEVVLRTGMPYKQAVKRLDADAGGGDVSIGISYLYLTSSPTFKYAWYDLPNGMHIGITGDVVKTDKDLLRPELRLLSLSVCSSRQLRSGKGETWYDVSGMRIIGKRVLLEGLKVAEASETAHLRPAFLYRGMPLTEARKSLAVAGARRDKKSTGHMHHYSLPQMAYRPWIGKGKPVVINVTLTFEVERFGKEQCAGSIKVDFGKYRVRRDIPVAQPIKYEVVDLNDPLGKLGKRAVGQAAAEAMKKKR